MQQTSEMGNACFDKFAASAENLELLLKDSNILGILIIFYDYLINIKL